MRCPESAALEGLHGDQHVVLSWYSWMHVIYTVDLEDCKVFTRILSVSKDNMVDQEQSSKIQTASLEPHCHALDFSNFTYIDFTLGVRSAHIEAQVARSCLILTPAFPQ